MHNNYFVYGIFCTHHMKLITGKHYVEIKYSGYKFSITSLPLYLLGTGNHIHVGSMRDITLIKVQL